MMEQGDATWKNLDQLQIGDTITYPIEGESKMDVNSIITAVSVIISIVIGFALNLWRDIIMKNKELEQKELEYQKDYKEKYISMPIISSIDELLKMIERYYVSGLGDFQADTTAIYEQLWDKGGTIKARIISLDDDLLHKTYNDFIDDIKIFLDALVQGKPVENSEVIKIRKDAHLKAGFIFDRLKPKLSRIRN